MAARSFAILCAALLLGFSAAAVASTGSTGSTGTSGSSAGGHPSGGGSGGGAGHAGGGHGSAGHSGMGSHGAARAAAAHGRAGAGSAAHQQMHMHSHMPGHPHHFRMTSFADVSNHSGMEWAPYCVQDNYLERFYNCPGTRKRTTVFDPDVSVH